MSTSRRARRAPQSEAGHAFLTRMLPQLERIPAKITVPQPTVSPTVASVRCPGLPPPNGRPAPPMSSSPAWLTIALTTLASEASTAPSAVLQSGIRALPAPHVLHHLNRWARHVWRPAVTARALANLTREPARPTIEALGPGAVSLLSALVDAVRRCNAVHWLDVLGVMFLADDPWAIEVGRVRDGKDVDRAIAAMRFLYDHKKSMLVEIANSQLPAPGAFDAEIDGDSPVQEESYAELRCRVAALQLQLDDVAAVARRNEKNTKDLLSSFHFWSMLLLDELRGYKAQLAGRSAGGSHQGNGSSGVGGETVFQAFAKHVGKVAAENSADVAANVLCSDGATTPPGAPGSQRDGGEPPRGKRVFRDGKWIEL